MKHVFKGNGAPTGAPTALGQHYIDLDTGTHYNSVGTTSADDWKAGGEGGASDLGFLKVNATQGNVKSQRFFEFIDTKIRDVAASVDDIPPDIPPEAIEGELVGIITDTTNQLISEFGLPDGPIPDPIVDLAAGYRHRHILAGIDSYYKFDGLQPQIDLGIGNLRDDPSYTPAVTFPIARSHSNFRIHKLDSGDIVLWSAEGELFVIGDILDIGQNSFESYGINLAPNEEVIELIDPLSGSDVVVLTSAGNLYYVGNNYQRVRKVDYFIAVDENSSNNESVKATRLFPGVGSNDWFIGTRWEHLAYTDDDGETWTDVSIPLDLITTTQYGFRMHGITEFAGDLYCMLSQFINGDIADKLVVLKFDRVNKTWSNIHTTTTAYDRVSIYRSPDRSKLIIANGRNTVNASTPGTALTTEDGVTFIESPLTLDQGYFNPRDFKVEIFEDTQLLTLVRNGGIYGSVNGLDWTRKSVNVSDTLGYVTDHVFLPLSFDGEIDSRISVLTYKNGTGFTYLYQDIDEPDVYWTMYKPTLNVFVLMDEVFEQPMGSVNSPTSDGEVLTFELKLDNYTLPAGIDHRLIRPVLLFNTDVMEVPYPALPITPPDVPTKLVMAFPTVMVANTHLAAGRLPATEYSGGSPQIVGINREVNVFRPYEVLTTSTLGCELNLKFTFRADRFWGSGVVDCGVSLIPIVPSQPM